MTDSEEHPAFKDRREQVRRARTRRVLSRRLGDEIQDDGDVSEYLRLLLSDLQARVKRLEDGRRALWIVLGGIAALGWALAFIGLDRVMSVLSASP